MFTKKGQLGIIEFKFFFFGLIAGLLGGWILVLLGTKKVIPFQIPVVCGSVISSKFFNKKGQLGMIELQYFMGGFAVGIVGSLILVYLGTTGILPFKIPLVCPVSVK